MAHKTAEVKNAAKKPQSATTISKIKMTKLTKNATNVQTFEQFRLSENVFITSYSPTLFKTLVVVYLALFNATCEFCLAS